jgi:NAD-dependent SIR2 family protein deacetylase
MQQLHEIIFAAEAIREADALLITAGAGMGVDSGLPDFRGGAGFWNAYPAYRELGLNFVELANPRWFREDPKLAWGFYGHRLNLYRSTSPHSGFDILRTWGERMPRGYRVFTSNVDGHFQRAGFAEELVTEVHGSINHVQCCGDCGIGIFSAADLDVQIDSVTFRAQSLPICAKCGALLRPNILMFEDWEWDGSRTALQERKLNRWLDDILGCRLVVVEFGAGTAIPTVRRFSETVCLTSNATLIRINITEPQVPAGNIGLEMSALAALRAILVD